MAVSQTAGERIAKHTESLSRSTTVNYCSGGFILLKFLLLSPVIEEILATKSLNECHAQCTVMATEPVSSHTRAPDGSKKRGLSRAGQRPSMLSSI
jgi:hypothetical protein